MFNVSPGQQVAVKIGEAEKNYVIQKNDLISLAVYTNKGERIIDPDSKLENMQSTTAKDAGETLYLVDQTGLARFPMIGEIRLEGLSLRKAEEALTKEFSHFYQDPYIFLAFKNKRAIVLGAPGGKVVPLTNEGMTLSEVLALSNGLPPDSKAHNVRILRGDTVFVADLSTIDGYKKGNIIIQSGDIVYVEPVRKPFVEGFRDVAPLVSLVTSLATLFLLILK